MLSIRISSIKNTFLSVISEEDYRIIYTGIEYVPNTRLIKITIHTSPKSKFSTKLRLLTGHRHFRQKIFNYRNTQINDFHYNSMIKINEASLAQFLQIYVQNT
jgi:hypothetical protein